MDFLSQLICLLFLIPLLSLIFVIFSNQNIRLISLIGLIFCFLLSCLLLLFFNFGVFDFQIRLVLVRSETFNLNYTLAVDSLSVLFIFLTSTLTSLCVISSWNLFYKMKEYLITILTTQFLLTNVFLVTDLLLFYVFFESILIPFFLLIGVWGSRDRKIIAAYQFFLYTLFGSVFMLMGILFVYYHSGTTDLVSLNYLSFSTDRQFILWFLFFIAFAIKVPMLPVHIWLPEAHVEAPTSGSVLLAGVLLKLGTYAIIRFLLSLFPLASFYFTPFVFVLGVLGILYTSLSTLSQVDLKKIVAYSSVAHMSLVTVGIFGFNEISIGGSIFLMLSHGIVSGALFFLIGIVYDRYKTRLITYYGGLLSLMPLFSLFLLIFSLANMGLPGTGNFIGEFLILMGVFNFNTTVSVLSSLGVIFSAAYSLWLYNRLVTGSIKMSFIRYYSDLTLREFSFLIGLIFLTVFTGIFPSFFLNFLQLVASLTIELMLILF